MSDSDSTAPVVVGAKLLSRFVLFAGDFLFALLVLLSIIIVMLVQPYGTRSKAYRFAVHFPNANHALPGSPVYFQLLQVGYVDELTVLPDNTVVLVLTLNGDIDLPADSKFTIRPAPVGTAQIEIAAGRSRRMWPHEWLPVENEPIGTISDKPAIAVAYRVQSDTEWSEKARILAIVLSFPFALGLWTLYRRVQRKWLVLALAAILPVPLLTMGMFDPPYSLALGLSALCVLLAMTLDMANNRVVGGAVGCAILLTIICSFMSANLGVLAVVGFSVLFTICNIGFAVLEFVRD